MNWRGANGHPVLVVFVIATALGSLAILYYFTQQLPKDW